MDDSSLNPYIPDGSVGANQQAAPVKSPLRRIVRTALIVTGAVILVIGLALLFIVPRTSVEDKKARAELAGVLQPADQVTKLLPISSTRGFSMSYENQLYTSYAETSAITTKEDIGNNAKVLGEYFENNDLRTPREYSLVRIRPLESADSSRAMTNQPPELEVRAYSKKLLDDNAVKPEYKGLSRQALFMKLGSEQRLAARDASDGTTLTIEESKPASRNINGVQYQRIRYTTTNDNHRITNVKYDDCYYTLQNDLPYSACIVNVRPHNTKMASLVEQVLESVSYKKPTASTEDIATSTTTDDKGTAKDPKSTESKDDKVSKDSDDSKTLVDDTDTDEKVEQKEASLITKTPEYLENGNSLRAVAVNQPSVVRIGSLYCADVALKLESGETGVTLTDACVGKLSTGVVVSKDGYIATTGGVARYDPEAAINGYINFAEGTTEMENRLSRVLDYLIKARIIMQSDADYLKLGAKSGDQEALAKIENIGSIIPDNYISPSDEKYSYAIQPTDRPIVINRTAANKPEFAYSDSVREAKFVAANYDTKKAKQENFDQEMPTVDTALLKMEGSFQNVTMISGDGVKANDKLNLLGFPAFTDAGLTIDRLRNMPFVTYASVDQTFKSDNHRTIQLSSAVLPGSNGAPVFDQSSNLIGFGVYGLSYCPNQQCFATGTVRSTAELLAMIEKENVVLGELSSASKTWTKAVDEYMRGNYGSARGLFAKAGQEYSFNMWAEKLAQLSQKQQGSASDTTLLNQLQVILISVMVILVVVTAGLSAAYLIHNKRIDSLQLGHYGAMAPVMPVSSTPQTDIQPVMSAPVAQAWQPQAGTDVAMPQVQATPDVQPVDMFASAPQQTVTATDQLQDQSWYSQPAPQAVQPAQESDPVTPQVADTTDSLSAAANGLAADGYVPLEGSVPQAQVAAQYELQQSSAPAPIDDPFSIPLKSVDATPPQAMDDQDLNDTDVTFNIR